MKELGAVGENFTFTSKRIHMDDLPWHVDCIDAPTAKGTTHEMAQQLKQADLAIFVADASRLNDSRYQQNATELATTLRGLEGTHTRWILLLTHADYVRPQPAHPSDLDEVGGYERLQKLLDEREMAAFDLTDRASSTAAVRRVIARLKEEET